MLPTDLSRVQLISSLFNVQLDHRHLFIIGRGAESCLIITVPSRPRLLPPVPAGCRSSRLSGRARVTRRAGQIRWWMWWGHVYVCDGFLLCGLLILGWFSAIHVYESWSRPHTRPFFPLIRPYTSTEVVSFSSTCHRPSAGTLSLVLPVVSCPGRPSLHTHMITGRG